MRGLALAAAGLLASVGSTLAECNNACSGHGRCGNDDVCSCYPMWGGSDCGERKCPSRLAWADIKDTTVTNREPHFYAECSGRGRCDKELGQCVCDSGFEGEACDRLSCPNNCNGHGRCELMSSANSAYDGWDADKIQVCVCDAGYEGYDCLDRKCKLGDDPISRYDSSGSAEAAEEQNVAFSVTNGFASGSTFLLEYEDWRGAKWLTRPIPVLSADGLSASFIEEALLSLPQRAIDSVTVTLGTTGAAAMDFTVTFDSTETPGNQPKLIVHTEGCSDHGCQPVYAGIRDTSVVAERGSPTVTETDGTGQRLVCSGRGKCDSEFGECRCHRGFYGHACEKQTLVL